MKKLTFILISLLVTIMCFGQGNDITGRDSFTLNLAVDSVNFYQSEIPASPYILPDNSVQIYPGEKIFIEIELKNRIITRIKNVKENLNPEKTMIISFEQKTSNRNHELMMLKIENPFEFKLDYKAVMLLFNNSTWVPTSILPVEAKLSSFETWPDILISIALSGWKFK